VFTILACLTQAQETNVSYAQGSNAKDRRLIEMVLTTFSFVIPKRRKTFASYKIPHPFHFKEMDASTTIPMTTAG